MIVTDEAVVGAHRTHCCKRHGCKYLLHHAHQCPVAHGFETQMAGCNFCYGEDEAREKALDVLTEKMNEAMRDMYKRKLPEEYQKRVDFEFFHRSDFEREVDILIDAGMLNVEVW